MDEIRLVRDATSSAEAFAELYRRHVTRVYRYHLAHTGIPKDAEDLTSQTFRAALGELRSFRGGVSFAAWIMGIAAKKRPQDLRGRRRGLPIDAVLYYQSSALPTDRAAMQRMEFEAVSRLLKQISTDREEALILYFFGDLSDVEVSRVLKKSAATTEMLIASGIQDLRTRTSPTPEGETIKDQVTSDPNLEDEGLADKLTNIANQIVPDSLFISELEQVLVASHKPRTKSMFSLQQIASLAGWAALMAVGVFLLNWRVTSTSSSTQPVAAHSPTPFICPITEPNGSAPPNADESPLYYGNNGIWTRLWPNGRVIMSTANQEDDGSFTMQWTFLRFNTGGELQITGLRLDAKSKPLGLLSGRNNESGDYVARLNFPTDGCWEVTASTVAAKLTFVTEVVFGEVTSSPSRPTTKATATSISTLEYIVQEGDTCTYIANRFGVTINQLITINALNSSCDIRIDQKLLIPITATSTPEIN